MGVSFYNPEKLAAEEVSLSVRNAALVLQLLGYPADEFDPWDNDGIPAAELADRCRLALQTLREMPEADSGLDAVQDGNFIDCGLRAGYYTQRIQQILTLAEGVRGRVLLA